MRAPRRWLALLLVLLAAPASADAATYDPAGAYLDATSWPPTASYSWTRFDDAGVPQVLRDGAWVYNTVTIAEYGLQEWSYRAAGQGDEHLNGALAAADWLLANQRTSGAWTYDFDFPVSGMDVTLQAPWISAMAQGQAISLLTRVWRATGDQRYLDAARAALGPFQASVADGGVVAGFYPKDASLPYYEEYPTTPPSFTLNGFMFALLGLYDLAVTDPASPAGDRYRQGMATLRVALPYYDTGGVSAYHLGYLTDGQPVHTSLKYHRIHVVELAALDSIEPNATLELYHDRWAAYPPAPVPVSAPPVAPPVSPPPTSTSAAMPTSAVTPTGCRYAGHRVRRRGVSCRRARRVLRAYLRRHRELRRWHCHRGARIVCRRYTHRVSIAAPRAT